MSENKEFFIKIRMQADGGDYLDICFSKVIYQHNNVRIKSKVEQSRK